MFRRRKMATVTDIEVARRAASANGAYDPSWESGLDAAPSARHKSLESLSVPVNFPSDACPCGGHIGWIQHEDRFVGNCHGRCRKRHVELRRDTDDDLRRRTREAVWERRFREAGLEVPTSIAAACVQIDRLKTENARMRDQLERARVDVAAVRAMNGRLAP